MLEGKPVQQHEHPAMSTSGSDIDLEDEREKIRQELQKEFEEQIKALQEWIYNLQLLQLL